MSLFSSWRRRSRSKLKTAEHRGPRGKTLRFERLERRDLLAAVTTLSSTDDWDVMVTDTASDAAGNNYVSGVLSPRSFGVGSIPAGPIDLDPVNVYGDDRDILATDGDKGLAFFVKYGPSGMIEWVNRMERINSGTVHADIHISSGPGGGLYFTGLRMAELRIGSTLLTEAGPGADRYAGSFLADGSLEWVMTFATGFSSWGDTRDVTVDAARQRLYVSGHEKNSSGSPTGVIHALNIANPSLVNVAWSRTLVASGSYSSFPHAYVGSMAIDSSGNVSAAASINGSVDFDPGKGKVTLSSGSSSKFNPGVVWTLSPAGNYISALQFQSSNNSGYSIDGIAIDSSNNLYVAGSFSGTVDFQTGRSVKSLTSSDGSDVYVVKLSPSHVVQFAKQHGAADGDGLADFALDASGVYLAYTTRSATGTIMHSTIAKFDLNSANPNAVWSYTLYGSARPVAMAVSPSTGRVRVVGIYQSIDTDSDGTPDVFDTQDGDAFWLDLEQV